MGLLYNEVFTEYPCAVVAIVVEVLTVLLRSACNWGTVFVVLYKVQ